MSYILHFVTVLSQDIFFNHMNVFVHLYYVHAFHISVEMDMLWYFNFSIFMEVSF